MRIVPDADIHRSRAEDLAKKQARSVNESIRDVMLTRARLGLPGISDGLADLYRAIEAMKLELDALDDAA